MKIQFIIFCFNLILAIHAKADVFSKLNSGWPANLAPIYNRLPQDRSFLISISRTPYSQMDLRSAESLRKSLRATPNEYLSDIGHNTYGWICSNIEGQRKIGFTSHTGELSNQIRSMVQYGWGLTPFITTFTDGMLRDPKENDKITLAPFINSPEQRLFALVVEVSDQECESAYRFTEKFSKIDPQTGRFPGQYFGLALDPYKFEGGGCGSTTVAALDQANFFGDASPYFWRDIKLAKRHFGFPKKSYSIPNALIPAPIEAPWHSKNRNVPIAFLTMQDWSSEENSFNLRLIDPEMMFLFYRTLMQEKIKQDLEMETTNIEQAQKINSSLERSMTHYHAVQYKDSDPKYTKHLIDENFDPIAAAVVKSAKQWYQDKVDNDYYILRPKWGTQSALIFLK
jgi:hypothetical protein